MTGLKTDSELEEIDVQIENARKQFYSSLLDKKRNVKRKWLEVGSITNEQLIATLPYRALLNIAEMKIEKRNSQVEADDGENLLDKNITLNDELKDSETEVLPEPQIYNNHRDDETESLKTEECKEDNNWKCATDS